MFYDFYRKSYTKKPTVEHRNGVKKANINNNNNYNTKVKGKL